MGLASSPVRSASSSAIPITLPSRLPCWSSSATASAPGARCCSRHWSRSRPACSGTPDLAPTTPASNGSCGRVRRTAQAPSSRSAMPPICSSGWARTAMSFAATRQLGASSASRSPATTSSSRSRWRRSPPGASSRHPGIARSKGRIDATSLVSRCGTRVDQDIAVHVCVAAGTWHAGRAFRGWGQRPRPMAAVDLEARSTAHPAEQREPDGLIVRIVQVLCVLVPLAIWFAPLPLEPQTQHAFAVVGFMVIAWITQAMDYALAGFVGCFLFWALGIVKFPVAFSGFANDTAWFLFGALLIGAIATRSGVARRLAYWIILRVGTTYPRILLGLIVTDFLLTFIVPSGIARVVIMAAIAIGLADAFDAAKGSNVARGMFLILTYTANIF